MKKQYIYLIAVSIVLAGCISEDHFGLSEFGNIRGIEVSNQASQARIDNLTATVEIEMPAGVDLSQTVVKVLTLSSFATADLKEGDLIDFRDSVLVNITAEGGQVTQWTLKPAVASNTPQLANSDFNQWYQTSAGYFEPGESAESTIWGTGNPGTQLLGLVTTTPLELPGQDLTARMETLDNGSLPAALGFPISAGTVYTGKFDTDKLDPSNPRAAIDFGTPFAGRPGSFKLKYRYTPGPENKDKSGQPLGFDDNCDIYALLEIRDSGGTRRLATAWFRSDQQVDNLTDLTVTFTYGPLDDSFPDYTKPPDGKYVSEDSARFVLPSHITFVASSSFDGDLFNGAIGSTLVIDDLELVYDQ